MRTFILAAEGAIVSLYERIKSSHSDTGHNQISIWGLLNDMSLLLDGDCTFAELAARSELDSSEQAELSQILLAVQTQMANGSSRQDIFHGAWHTLVAIERGVITEQRALQRLGVN